MSFRRNLVRIEHGGGIEQDASGMTLLFERYFKKTKRFGANHFEILRTQSIVLP
jgi:hypothetical protein